MSSYAMARSYERKPIRPEWLAYHGAQTATILSVLYLLTVCVTGESWLPIVSIDAASPALMLSLLQCLLGVAALQVPALLVRRTRIRLPDGLCACFYAFVLAATVLGEMFSLYYRIPIWDSILHLGSGVMLGMLGSILLVQFLQAKNCQRLLSPAAVAVAAICFAVCAGVAWEMYEFAGDSLLGLNMQKCLLEDGTALVGKAALMDTMKDLLVDTLGAAVGAVWMQKKQKK